MHNPIVVVGLGILALAGFSLFAGWAFFATQHLGPGWPYAIGAAVIVGGLTAFFMWLAFYSANHRYDGR